MSERRASWRNRSFLQGRIYYNNRRASIDCLIREISDIGARLEFSETIAVPEAMELYIPHKQEIRRVRAQWRTGDEMGVAFEGVTSPSITPDMPASDLAARVRQLEMDVLVLKRMVNELRAENRKQQGEVV